LKGIDRFLFYAACTLLTRINRASTDISAEVGVVHRDYTLLIVRDPAKRYPLTLLFCSCRRHGVGRALCKSHRFLIVVIFDPSYLFPCYCPSPVFRCCLLFLSVVESLACLYSVDTLKLEP